MRFFSHWWGRRREMNGMRATGLVLLKIVSHPVRRYRNTFFKISLIRCLFVKR
jgi:hypothetical protein